MLDVGGHRGQTLVEVVKPRWRFDAIWTFEPAAECWPLLQPLYDGDRVQLEPAGWWTEDTSMPLHDPGEIGASVYADKARSGTTQAARFIDCAAWIDTNLRPDDIVWVKLNCEGAECAILEHLLDTGRITRLRHLLVHFDAEKIPEIADRADAVRRRLDQAGVAYAEPGQIWFGRGHAAKTANWLAWTEAGPVARLRYSILHRGVFRARQLLYPAKVRLRQAMGRRSAG